MVSIPKTQPSASPDASQNGKPLQQVGYTYIPTDAIDRVFREHTAAVDTVMGASQDWQQWLPEKMSVPPMQPSTSRQLPNRGEKAILNVEELPKKDR